MTARATYLQYTVLDGLIVTGTILFVILIGIWHVSGTQIMQSDVLGYSEQSHHWWLANMHLPGYAFLLWVARGLTLGAVSDLILMQTISLAAWYGSLYIFLKIARKINPDASQLATVLYGLFPFVGITYVAWPIADSVAHFVLIYGIFCLFERDWRRLMVALAVMLLVQKALWPFALLISLAAWHRGFPVWRALAAGAPLAIFWLAVAASGAGPLWIISIDLSVNLPSYSGLPVLDGVLGTLAQGGMRGTIKGLLLLSLFVGTVILTWIYIRRRNLEMLSILIPVLGLLVFMNQHEAWASIRYAKILVIPLIGVTPLVPRLGRFIRASNMSWIVIGVLAATQVAYAMHVIAFHEVKTELSVPSSMPNPAVNIE
jgi:hypothetical protein